MPIEYVQLVMKVILFYSNIYIKTYQGVIYTVFKYSLYYAEMLPYKSEELQNRGNVSVLYTRTTVMSTNIMLFLYFTNIHYAVLSNFIKKNPSLHA